MKRTLVNRQSTTRKLLQLFLLCAVLLAPKGAWAQDTYDLWIGDNQVTSDNRTSIPGSTTGTISFNPESNTLTLNGVTISGQVKTGLPNLIIDLIGTNTITTNGVDALDVKDNVEAYPLTIMSSSAERGNLTLKNTNTDSYCGGVVSSSFFFNQEFCINIDESLAMINPKGSMYYLISDTTHLARFVPALGVTIGDTPIHDGNFEDVFKDDDVNGGKVSFDKTTGTLTLNGAKLSGPIESNLEELTIKIAGDNSLTLSYNGALFQSRLDRATINIEQASNASGILVATMNSNNDGIANSNVTLNITQPLSLLSGDSTKTDNSSVIIGTQLFSGGGDGSADSPYLISTTDDLLNFSNWVNIGAVQTEGKIFQLYNDIDFTNESDYSFEPIGRVYGFLASYPFKGRFNGDDKKIIGLNCNSHQNFESTGFFGQVGSGSATNGVAAYVSNVSLVNCKFVGEDNVGAVAGNLVNGTISNCTVDGCTIFASNSSQSASNAYAGGVLGKCSEGTTISGNRVMGKTIVYAETKYDTNLYSGAISGCKSGAFSDNLYYPTVITQIKYSDTEISEKSGSQQRGIGEVVDVVLQMDYHDITTDQGALLCYELKIGNNLITGANASNVYGDNGVTVSYDYNKNLLTLNGATLGATAEQNITVYTPSLSVKLIGDNTINGGFELADNTARDLIFITDAATASLTMTSPIPESFTVTCNNKLILANTRQTVMLPTDYGITIAGTTLTPSNHTDVAFGTGTVTFDTNGQLILNGAVINGEIVVAETAQLPEAGLKIFLQGNSTITNATGNAITYLGATSSKLTFVTDANTAGTLVYTNSSAPTIETAFNNFTVEYGNGLTSKIDNNTLTIVESMPMTVDHVNDEKTTDYSTLDPSESTNNVLKDGFLYTTGETAGNFGATSGLAEIEGKTRFVFTEGSAMDQSAVDAITAEPCTKAYADAFIGATAKVPAGEVTVEASACADANHAVMLKVAGQTPIMIGIPNSLGSYVPRTFRFHLSVADIMQIYLQRIGSSSAPRMSNHRIGPKSSVAGALGGVKVTSSSIQISTPPAPTYKVMEKSQVTSAIASVGDAMGGYTCNDPDITDLPDDMFVDKTPSPAPRRGAGVKTILPDGLTFVNFSGTKITGMEVSREKGAFNGVPENVFIYMPAGNSVAKGTKNVVIGGICDVMELNGGVDAKPFKANKDFKAGQVTLKRTFEEGSATSKATIYLPYAISQEDANKLGKFYTLTNKSYDVVTMSQVTTGGLQANKPYIFEATTGGVVDPMVRTTDIVANPSSTDIFKGVYARKDYEYGMYCYAAEATSTNAKGEFVWMDYGSYVPPFRAYMIGDGTPSYAILWDGVVENMEEEPNMTAVETVKTTQNKKAAEGWWTLNGVRLNGQPQKPGMYIVNGRLVVVK